MIDLGLETPLYIVGLFVVAVLAGWIAGKIADRKK